MPAVEKTLFNANRDLPTTHTHRSLHPDQGHGNTFRARRKDRHLRKEHLRVHPVIKGFRRARRILPAAQELLLQRGGPFHHQLLIGLGWALTRSICYCHFLSISVKPFPMVLSTN